MDNSTENNTEGINSETTRLQTEVNSICCCRISTQKFASLVYMAIVFLLGVVFLVAGKVDTDQTALHVSENSVYRYLTAMLLLAILWMAVLIFSKFIPERITRWLAKHEEPAKQLIPTRLLVGIIFFGLGSSFMTMVEFLEFFPGYVCPLGDATMPFYYAVRTMFIYTQLYFFYKLSSRSKKILFFSHVLTMHLIAVNLGTWIVTFVHDSAEELRGEDENPHQDNTTELNIFMARRWGVDIRNQTTNETACQKRAADFKSTAKTMEPYFYTFTMEYCLISAGLLLNVWLSLRCEVPEETTTSGHEGDGAGSDRGESRSSAVASNEDTDWEEVQNDNLQEVGTLWRFGFIFGLVYVPAFAAMIINIMFADTSEEDNLIYIGFQFFFFFSVLVASVFGTWQLDKQAEGEIHSKVDFYLLAGALVGVFFLDMFIIIPSFCEVGESTSIALFLIFTNMLELGCSVAFTHFVHKALERNLHSDKTAAVLNSASNIRQVVSFLFMLNLCFWAMYTFEVKKSNKVVSLMETFYGKIIWFYISHIVYPLAIFFHFHGAVCMVEILNLYSRVPLKGISSSSSTSSFSPHHAVQVHSCKPTAVGHRKEHPNA